MKGPQVKKHKTASVKGWLDPLPEQENILQELATSALRAKARGCDVELWDAIVSRDYEALLNWPLVYGPNDDIMGLVAQRQALAFYKKHAELPIKTNKRENALVKWMKAESDCAQTNLRLKNFWITGNHPVAVTMAIAKAQKNISKILGPCPSISDLKLAFGPGATTNIPKKDASPSNKMGGGLTCSPGLYASRYFAQILAEIPHWLEALGLVTEYGVALLPQVTLSYPKLAHVPKDALTTRIVTPEPTLNGFVQKAIGKYITKVLKRAGIDIKDQTKNQRLARLGSLTGERATLDLVSASDTLATVLLRLLIVDDEWFQLLDACRSKKVVVNGSQTLTTSKFSGMGNGFIFPLETLVFWALAHVYDPHASAYGDDLVVCSDAVDDIVGLLEYCGFTVNTGKSYVDPAVPFRESCGADYYKGIDIRPFYQRTLFTPETLFNLYNFYIRHHSEDLAAEVLALIPRHLRLWGPDGYGDGHLVSLDWKSNTTQKMIRKGWTGLRFDTYTHVAIQNVTKYPGDWVSPLYSIYISDGEPLLGDQYFERVNLNPRLRSLVHGALVSSTPLKMLPDGRPCWTTPGTRGYKRVSVYILA